MASKAQGVPKSVRSVPSAGDRLHSRLSIVGRSTSGLVTSPAPLWTGDDLMARRLASGLLHLGGAMVEARDQMPWDITPPSASWGRP